MVQEILKFELIERTQTKAQKFEVIRTDVKSNKKETEKKCAINKEDNNDYIA